MTIAASPLTNDPDSIEMRKDGKLFLLPNSEVTKGYLHPPNLAAFFTSTCIYALCTSPFLLMLNLLIFCPLLYSCSIHPSEPFTCIHVWYIPYNYSRLKHLFIPTRILYTHLHLTVSYTPPYIHPYFIPQLCSVLVSLVIDSPRLLGNLSYKSC